MKWKTAVSALCLRFVLCPLLLFGICVDAQADRFRLVPENTTKFALGGTAPCMCESKDQAASYAWYFRGVLRLSSVPGLNLYTEGNTAVMEVELLEEWDSSIVYCQARMLNGVWLTSPEAMIQIQGILYPVTNLRVTNRTLYGITVAWDPPVSLDIPDMDPDFNHTVEVCTHDGDGSSILCDAHEGIFGSNFTFPLSDYDSLSGFRFTVYAVNAVGRGNPRVLNVESLGEGLAEETQPVEVTTVSTTYEPQLSPQRSSSLVAIVVTACVCTLAVFLVTASVISGCAFLRHRYKQYPVDIACEEIDIPKTDETISTTTHIGETTSTTDGVTTPESESGGEKFNRKSELASCDDDKSGNRTSNTFFMKQDDINEETPLLFNKNEECEGQTQTKQNSWRMGHVVQRQASEHSFSSVESYNKHLMAITANKSLKKRKNLHGSAAEPRN